jgi:hypothetical protein
VPKLFAPADGNRPAIVVIGSGGGTRAALYTSHVLQGLHGIGAGEDIVLPERRLRGRRRTGVLRGALQRARHCQ